MRANSHLIPLVRKPLTFVATSWTLQEVFERVVHDDSEDIILLTGERLGTLHVLSRICPVTARSRSLAHARVMAGDLISAAGPILDHGLWIEAYAHSHPGYGPDSTWPSSIDIDDLGNAQRRGSQAVGLIFSRDGCCRFFSPLLPMRVLVLGNGFTKLDTYVFQLHLPISSPPDSQGAEIAVERLLTD